MMFLSLGSASRKRDSQFGGISILVTLMMLVLLTIASLAMSRNSFREIVASGTIRQGAMARNLADSGIEYGIIWLTPPNVQQAGSSSPSAQQLQTLASWLAMNKTNNGVAYNLDKSLYTGTNSSTPNADLQVPPGSGNGYNLSLTAMGKMEPIRTATTGGSTNSGYQSQFNTSATSPDIWSLRSDGVYNAAGIMKFTNSKETWITTPSRTVVN